METLEQFYQRKFDWIPENIKSGIGHFNVFKHQPVDPDKPAVLAYNRRDYYKIMLVEGNIEMQYADQIIEVKKQALFFSNPLIPYQCSNVAAINEGYYCIFNAHFFQKYGDIMQYSVFQPNGNHVFEISDDQLHQIKPLYLKMFEEINSDYEHKYDVLRNLVFELLHFAMKIHPADNIQTSKKNASKRISTLFLELLERQFPIDQNHTSIKLRSASDFADQLNVHVNHLNRALKETTLKTTTQIIADRILQESKILLMHSKWNISEIAYALGFTEVTHFNNFFKKNMLTSPSKFRNEY